MLLCSMQVKLSAVIITLNEEKNIERCILSLLEVVDEILVVDSFSTDQTKVICEKYGVRFLEHAFKGHIEQKNWAKDQSTYPYVISLDADEALDELLKKAVLKLKENWKYDAYKMNRLTNYCGKWIHHSGWYPDTKIRLFDRRKGRWGGNNPHDHFIPDEGVQVKHIKGNILHYSFYTREEHLKQIHYFSTISAKSLHAKGRVSSAPLILMKSFARFIKSFIIQKGFLDGFSGFTISRLSAYANYLKYVKLKKLQKGEDI